MTRLASLTIRFEYLAANDHHASKQADQILDFGRAFGDVFIVDETFPAEPIPKVAKQAQLLLGRAAALFDTDGRESLLVAEIREFLRETFGNDDRGHSADEADAKFLRKYGPDTGNRGR